MFEKLAAYLASQLDINEEDITEETTFESLGIDSLDTVEMLMDLEEELGVELEMEEKVATDLVIIFKNTLSLAPACDKVALAGEIAVPCYLQSAIAGVNSHTRA